MTYTIKEERLSAEEYIEFLKHTDLGSQYPKERFRERIGTLVKRASISLVARNDAGKIIGVCFGITDFAYWLFITDLGVVRECAGKGIGTALVRKLHELAGGEENIIMYTCVNENAIPFYEKIGVVMSEDLEAMTAEQLDKYHSDQKAFEQGEKLAENIGLFFRAVLIIGLLILICLAI